MMGIVRDIRQFIVAHEPCGPLVRRVVPPTRDGYRVIITCRCGAVFDRWVTPRMARYDLIHSDVLVNPN